MPRCPADVWCPLQQHACCRDFREILVRTPTNIGTTGELQSYSSIEQFVDSPTTPRAPEFYISSVCSNLSISPDSVSDIGNKCQTNLNSRVLTSARRYNSQPAGFRVSVLYCGTGREFNQARASDRGISYNNTTNPCQVDFSYGAGPETKIASFGVTKSAYLLRLVFSRRF